MCSSPKSSSKNRRSAKKIEIGRAEYEEYARMVRRASTCYEEAQQRKAERRKQSASQQSLPINKQREASMDKGETQPSILAGIKTFFIQPVKLKGA